MNRYRAKPVDPPVVEARQFTEETADEVAEWAESSPYRGDRHGHTQPPWQPHVCVVVCGAGDDAATAEVGDWIVKTGVGKYGGEFVVVKPDEFATTYEPVPDGES